MASVKLPLQWLQSRGRRSQKIGHRQPCGPTLLLVHKKEGEYVQIGEFHVKQLRKSIILAECALFLLKKWDPLR